MVSHPETGSDSPIGSDRDRGRDIVLISKNGAISWSRLIKASTKPFCVCT